MPKENKKITPQECQFGVEGKVFCFNAPQVMVNLGAGYKTLKAEELVQVENESYVHADILVHLVEIGSGVIEEVEAESKSKSKKGGK